MSSITSIQGKSSKKRNAFYFFVIDKKKELEREGKMTKETVFQVVADMVGPVWSGMDEREREPYKMRAQKSRDTYTPPGGLDSLGLSIKSVQEAQVAKKQSDMEDMLFLRGLVAKYSLELETLPIIICKFNVYWQTWNNGQNRVGPSEVGLCAFSVERGLFDNFATLIDPGAPTEEDQVDPIETEKHAQQMHILDCNENREFKNYGLMRRMIKGFLVINNLEYTEEGDNIVFCLDQDIRLTEACFRWVNRGAEEKDKCKVRVHSLNTLIQLMSIRANMKMVNKKKQEIVPGMKEALELKDKMCGTVWYPGECPLVESRGLFVDPKHVDAFLSTNNFQYYYYDVLACLYHSKMSERNPEFSNVELCPLNAVNRYAYGLLDALLKNFDVVPVLGKHYPNLQNSELEAKERQRQILQWTATDYSKHVTGYLYLRELEIRQSQGFQGNGPWSNTLSEDHDIWGDLAKESKNKNFGYLPDLWADEEEEEYC